MLLWANSYLCALDHAGFRNLYHGTVLLRRRVQFDLGFRDFRIEEHTYLVCTFHSTADGGQRTFLLVSAVHSSGTL
jgi:hypothetical protein